jgi:tetratricopeptide (TPR) repeat protein
MKATSKISILFVLLFFSTMAAYSQCDTYLQKANTLFAEKKYEDAKRQYSNYKECKPNATGIDAKIAECDRLLKGENGTNSSNTSVQTLQEQCNRYLLEGDSYFRSGYYSKAIEQYSLFKQCAVDKTVAERKIAECNKMICEKHLQEAKSYQRQGYYTKAKEEYKLYQQCNPDAVGINVQIAECDRLECEKFLNEGRILYRQGNYSEAIQKYNQYKVCNPNDKTTADNEITKCNEAIQRKREADLRDAQRQIERTSRELQNLFRRR